MVLSDMQKLKPPTYTRKHFERVATAIGSTVTENTSHLLYDTMPECHPLTLHVTPQVGVLDQ
jgi:hypothetical protein